MTLTKKSIRPKRGRAAAWPQQMAELAVAVPQVVAHRVTRMAIAKHPLSARDRKEFHTMGAEKSAAFVESWAAMAAQAAAAQQQFALALMKQAFLPWTWAGGGAQAQRSAQALMRTAAQHAASAGANVLGHGLAPVHRRAVANAKRLRRTKLR